MDFEKHLFISYAHLDNVPLSAEQNGWISRFHVTLDALLSMRLGRRAIIWRDAKLAGNDVFANEIVDQFPHTAVLLCILSPRYLGSDWCAREVQQFCEMAEKSEGLFIGNKCRVVKIIKAPLNKLDPLPEVMRSMLGYQFYEMTEDGVPLELDPIFGAEMAQKYNVKVAKLAWELKAAIDSIEEAAPLHPALSQPISAAPQPRLTVYLAECTFDQRESREALEAELKCHGYRVLPEHQLSREEATYTKEVAGLLEQSQFSIHLVGSNYGAVPDGPTDKSIVVLQNEIATRFSKQQGLRRIIWLPAGMHPRQVEQEQFISQLQTDPEAQFGADLITSNERETMKSAMHAALAKLQAQPPPAPSDPAAERAPARNLVYLICDPRDRGNTVPLRKFLKQHGLQVRLPVFDGDAATVRKSNEDLLQECSAVLLFYAEGSEAWKRSVESEVRKMRGGSATPFPVWTCLASPETDAKRDLIDLEEPQIVNCLPAFSEDAVLPFIRQVQIQEFERVVK